jgi:hypothetical protein
MMAILKRTLESPFHSTASERKHHFFFIRALDSLVSKMFGEKMPEVDPLDELPYNLHLKKIFE